jgi:hypothetical protein
MKTQRKTLQYDYIKNISKKALSLALFGCLGVLFILSCDNSDDKKQDVTLPTLDFVSPNDGVTDAPIGGNITATFSEELDPATITTSSFKIFEGSTSVPGTV